MDLSFKVNKLAKFSSNPGKLNFEGLVHLLRYIRDSENLGLEYYADMNDVPVYNKLRQANTKTDNQLMYFYDSSWKYFPDTVRSTGEYIIFYQGGPIEHGTHVPGPVAQSISGSEYNSACTAGMALEHLRMLINEFLSKDTDIVTEEAPLIILDSESAMCMANNGKDTKHRRHITMMMHFVRNGEK